MTRFLFSVLLFQFALAAHSHPFGAYSVNHYALFELHSWGVTAQLLLDFAEITAADELYLLDIDGDNRVTEPEKAMYSERATARFFPHFTFFSGEKSVRPIIVNTQVSLLEGEAGITCMQIRWDCQILNPQMGPGPERQIRFGNQNYPYLKGKTALWVISHIPLSGTERFLCREPDMQMPQTDGVFFGESRGLEISFASLDSGVIPSPLEFSQIEPYLASKYPVLPGLPRGGDGSVSILKAPLTPSDAVQEQISLFQPQTDGLNSPEPAQNKGLTEEPSEGLRDLSWTGLITKNSQGWGFFIFALVLSTFFGAVHALSPGHGKTVVAAYLVGSKGTIYHAILLGIIVTVSHVFSVLLLGVITLIASQGAISPDTYRIIEAGSGLLIMGIGIGILVKRIKFVKKSFFHSHDGHRHSHSHSHDDHHHGDGHHHEIPGDVGFVSLLLLGISGGMVPCPSAIVVLLAAIAMHKIAFGLALILFFSIGLASILIIIGIGIVSAKKYISIFDETKKWQSYLLCISPVLVTLLGGILFIRSLL